MGAPIKGAVQPMEGLNPQMARLGPLDDVAVRPGLGTEGGERVHVREAVVIRGEEIVERFQTFVDPGRHLSNEIIALTGITDQMLQGAPKPAEALKDFLAFVRGRPLAAHNAEFDIGFIRAGCREAGLPADRGFSAPPCFSQSG